MPPQGFLRRNGARYYVTLPRERRPPLLPPLPLLLLLRGSTSSSFDISAGVQRLTDHTRARPHCECYARFVLRKCARFIGASRFLHETFSPDADHDSTVTRSALCDRRDSCAIKCDPRSVLSGVSSAVDSRKNECFWIVPTLSAVSPDLVPSNGLRGRRTAKVNEREASFGARVFHERNLIARAVSHVSSV